MTDSIIMNNGRIRSAFIVLFWLSLWQLGAWMVGSGILLVGPGEVFLALIRLLPERDFWISILKSFQTISLGFLAAFLLGILAGSLAYFHPFAGEFLAPAVAFMKSVPVASFVILALIWMGSEYLSVFIAFLVVFPVIYVQTTAGLASTDPKLLEMAQVFRITGWRKFSGLYWPALLPFLTSSCKTALGMSWKSGIAAEVIGVPEGTIGEQLYLSKIYLSTAQLFAWTLVIILASAGFERLFLFLLKQTGKGRFFVPEDVFWIFRGKGKRLLKKSSGVYGLTIMNLSKKFGSLEVLKEINICFSSRQPNGIMAPSGSGKTTLLRLLLGLEKPDSGSIQRTPDTPDPNSSSTVRTCPYSASPDLLAAAVFQEDRLCDHLSAIDNLRLALPDLPLSTIINELERLLPRDALARPAATLSGGMKRRTAILRAILAPSELIIMDEPFTGLDEETKEKVMDYIRERTTGKLLIFSTHQEEDIRRMGGIRFEIGN